MTKLFPIINLKGNPYDMGLAHGRVLVKEIKANLDLYFAMAQGLSSLEPNHCLSYAGRYLKAITEDAPALLEEMEGIANGAEVSLKEILFLNARSEIISVGWKPRTQAGECTAIGLTGERTTTGRPILAQNWDWHERVLGTSAVFIVKPDKGPKALFLAEAGQVGKIGFNEHGVGVVVNMLVSEEVSYGLPVHVLSRMILDTKDATEAVTLIKSVRTGGAVHFLIGDNHGHIMGLELTPTEVGEIVPENGVALHTNHYCVPKLIRKDIGRLLITDTITRLNRAESLILRRTIWSAEGLSELFSNHENSLGSICRHAKDSDAEFLRIVTVASCIIDLTGRKMLVSHGQPCRAPYQEVTLN